MTFPALYLIADPALYATQTADRPTTENAFFKAVHEALEGGVQWIQYREKHVARGKMYVTAKKLSEMIRGKDACLIINDDLDLALAVRADGVHLGQDDFPVSMARRLLGEKAVIGLSTHNLKQAQQTAIEAVDYIGFGPVFQTRTKENAEEPVGIEQIAALSKAVSLPIYAIGGIQYRHLADIISAGAAGVAVASGLAGAKKETFAAWRTRLAEAGLDRAFKV